MDEHIESMAKISNREKILTEGLRVVHEHGFSGASVRDIVQAAGVPQGSFTNHFASKEAFGLEILDLYFSDTCNLMKRTLDNETLAPLDRMHAYIDEIKDRLSGNGMRGGCLFGNFSAETSNTSEVIRTRLADLFGRIQTRVADCLRDAVTAGVLSAETDIEEVAGFFLSSLQGAILLAKAQRSLVPVERFEKLLFAQILR
jgi:TetR/AcrR family transcriptional regulator, transcriptional repressor for nem operon